MAVEKFLACYQPSTPVWMVNKIYGEKSIPMISLKKYPYDITSLTMYTMHMRM